MKIRVSVRARRDLFAIRDYIAQFNTAAAQRTIIRIQQSIRHLETYAEIGQEGTVDGTRQFPIPGLSYRVIYRSSRDTVFIERIVHTSRKWPDSFFES